MDVRRWERIQELFHRVVDLDPSQRSAVLANECADDPDLLSEVLAMIDGDQNAPALLDAPLNVVADVVLNAPADGDQGPQRTIGPYEIKRVLGEGGMGTVFFAVRRDLDTPAAIKVLRDSWISPARRERFAREQYLLAHLDHPNIARLFDASTLADGTPYFVMEYVEGVHLDNWCDLHASSLADRLRLFRSVCEAVQFAHRHAIIHRDLKPSNVLVKPDGTVKLLDFGIARQLDREHASADLTRTGLRLMTQAFASPEQIRGEPAAVGNDVYSLGVILYRLLTGRLPFDALSDGSDVIALAAGRNAVRPSLVARRVAQQAGAPAQPASVGAAEWADLDVICLKALHTDVQQRYGSVEALLRDIQHFEKGEPVEARPEALPYKIRKFVRRHRVAVVSTALGLIATFSLVMFFLARVAAERNAAIAEAARTHRIQQFMRNLFQGGDLDAGPSTDLRVTSLLDRGVIEARTLDKDPAAQAEFFETLGEIYRKLGNFDRADELFASALNRRTSISGANSAPTAELMALLALLRVDQARLGEAEKLAREALRVSRAALPPGHPGIAASTGTLGRVLEAKGAYPEAIAVLEDAVRLRSDGRHSAADLAGALYDLSNVYFYAGRYEDCDRVCRRVLDMNRQIYGERHPRVAEALVNLGAVQQDLGNYVEAEKFHRRALEITRGFFGENHYRTAAGLTMVARSLVFQKKFAEAVGLLQPALAIQERVFGASHPRVASALNELGTVALQQSDYAGARAKFSRMANIYRSVYGGDHYLMGTALSNLGSTWMAEKDYRRAEALFRQAAIVFSKTQSPQHLNTAIARIKLGRTLLRQKRFAEAEVESTAGYDILRAQMNPSVSWLKSARQDLVEVYEALGRSDKAAGLRVELASTSR